MVASLTAKCIRHRLAPQRFKGRFWPNPNPPACPLLLPYWGQTDINSASSDRLGLLGIPVHPASLIRLAGGAFLILGVS
jgi:hypothetical protein